MTISIIIPVYNEEKVIGACLESLSKQTKKSSEILVIDDGSTDNSLKIVGKLKPSFDKAQDRQISKLKILSQLHNGPGAARNLGAQQANGEILVFVDSDMTFADDFIETLVKPIEKGESKGTFTREEFVANWENVWARCWNYNQGLFDQRRIPKYYSNTAPVFRAILKKEFDQVGGFTEGIGWTDDWSLSQKLGYQSTATLAICFHANSATLPEVYEQAKWIGKNEFISGNIVKSIFNTVRFSAPVSLIIGFLKSIHFREPAFLLFKLTYDLGISSGIVMSYLVRNRNK